MILEYVLKLGLNVRSTHIGVQKINGSILKTFEMVLASFQIEDTLKKA